MSHKTLSVFACMYATFTFNWGFILYFSVSHKWEIGSSWVTGRWVWLVCNQYLIKWPEIDPRYFFCSLVNFKYLNGSVKRNIECCVHFSSIHPVIQLCLSFLLIRKKRPMLNWWIEWRKCCAGGVCLSSERYLWFVFYLFYIHRSTCLYRIFCLILVHCLNSAKQL